VSGDPGRTFALDQTDAAQAEAEAVALASMILTVTGPVMVTGPEDAGHQAAARDRFNAEAAAGSLLYCPHAGQVPVLWWFLAPGAPAACRDCLAQWAAAEELAGSSEDLTCDLCRGPMVPGTWLQCQVVLRAEPSGSRPGSVVVVQYGICRDCRRSSEEETSGRR